MRVNEEESLPLVPTDDKVEITQRPSVATATFNLMNVVFGVGILGIPFAFGKAGLIIGLFFVILIGFTTVLSFQLLLWASDEALVYTYPELGYSAMGIIGSSIVRIFFVLDLFGALIANVIVISDSFLKFLNSLADPPQFLLHNYMVIAFATILILPLSLLKNINWLSFTSLLSLVPAVYLIILQIAFLSAQGIESPIPLASSDCFLGLPIINFAFASQISFFSIYSELRQRGGTSHEMSKVGQYTTIFSTIIYATCGLLGILAYPTDIEGNIMLNFTPDVTVDILLVSMSIAVLFGYPVILFVLRETIDNLLFRNFKFSYIRFGIEAVLIIGVTYTVAIFVPEFIVILGLMGSITKVAICQIFPAFFYLRIGKVHWKKDKRKWVALFLIIVGGIAGIVSAVVTIIDKT